MEITKDEHEGKVWSRAKIEVDVPRLGRVEIAVASHGDFAMATATVTSLEPGRSDADSEATAVRLGATIAALLTVAT